MTLTPTEAAQLTLTTYLSNGTQSFTIVGPFIYSYPDQTGYSLVDDDELTLAELTACYAARDSKPEVTL